MLPPPLLFCLIWQLLTKIHKLKNSKWATKKEGYNVIHPLSWHREVWGPKVGTRWESPGLQPGHCLCLPLPTRHRNPLPRPFCSSYLPCSGEVLPNEQLLLGKGCEIHRASTEHIGVHQRSMISRACWGKTVTICSQILGESVSGNPTDSQDWWREESLNVFFNLCIHIYIHIYIYLHIYT